MRFVSFGCVCCAIVSVEFGAEFKSMSGAKVSDDGH